MAEDTDFAALYRELGIDATCSLADLRRAWRRRVAKLHPDQGGDTKDTGRLQQLNRLYDAAVDFHTLYGRMPGASPTGRLSPEHMGLSPQEACCAADIHSDEHSASGFGRISRYFVVVSLITIAVLGWRVVDRGPSREAPAAVGTDNSEDSGHPARIAAKPSSAAPTVALGMGKDKVRDILGEPLDMQALRWSYGPSWVEFRCDRVVDWYSSPLRPLRVSAVRETKAQVASPDDRDCD